MVVQNEQELKACERHLFDAVGIELEYMIVDSKTSDVKPITDKLIYQIAGDYVTEVECGAISYSNELALHVVELKTTQPEKSFENLGAEFHRHIQRINKLLEPFEAKLLPTACHPWMDPYREMKLWEHEYNPIYEAYHRIFDCRGHGWANLQSMHVNLPFWGDDEFYRLHSAIRLILPLLPALAASSPIMEGRATGMLDKRLDVYRFNQKKVPTIGGKIIPEVVVSKSDYEKRILEPIYRDIAPFDPDKILQFEWLNSRGAIARFDRNAIEIRVLDIQECPQADIAIAEAIFWVLKNIIESKWSDFEKHKNFPQEILTASFLHTIATAEDTIIENRAFLEVFGLSKPMTAKKVWCYLLQEYLQQKESIPLEIILRDGTLASRILRAWKKEPTAQNLRVIFEKLAVCLKEGEMFLT